MRDFGEYLRAYRAYVLANLGWGKALSVALVWLAGMFAPLVAKTLFELPNWVAMTWMIVWALLGYIFAPYGMWKHHRAQIASPGQRDRKKPRTEARDVRDELALRTGHRRLKAVPGKGPRPCRLWVVTVGDDQNNAATHVCFAPIASDCRRWEKLAADSEAPKHC